MSDYIIMPGNSFTKADIQKSLKYNPRENHPEFYGKGLPEGVEYLPEPILLEASEINLDTQFADGSDDVSKSIQQIRAKNQNRQELKWSLENGYDLREHLISVKIDESNGKYYIIDGRGKYHEMQKLGWNNFLVDVYKCKSNLGYSRLGNLKNNPTKPASPISKLDVVKHLINNRVELGIKDQLDYDDMDTIYRKEAKLIGNPNWQKSTIDKIVLQAINDNSKYQIVTHDENSASNWAKANNYIDSEKDGIYYLITSAATPAKTIIRAAKKVELLKDADKFKELRIILHHGYLEGSNPEQSWKETVDDGREQFNNYRNLLKNYFSGDVKISNKIKLYGITPSLEELQDEFPMNKVVRYDQPPLYVNKEEQKLWDIDPETLED